MNDNKPTTETYAVKLDSSVKEELQGLIREYDDQGTQGDFIKLLVDTFKTNKLSNTIVDSKADLRELNTLTTRIYGLYSNLIQRNNSSMEGIKADVNDKLESKDLVIIKLKEEIEELNESNNLKKEKIVEIKQLNESLVVELEDLKTRSYKDTMLIDKLNEEVEEIKELRIENKSICKEVKEIEKTLDFMANSNKELQEIINSNDQEIVELKDILEDTKLKYTEYLANKDIEHKREIGNLKEGLESDHMKEVLKIKEDYQNEIKNLQDKSFEDKEKLQDKYNERLDKSDEERSELQKEIEKLKIKLDLKVKKQ